MYQFQNAQISIPPADDIRKVYLELSSDCNFQCKMCFRHNFASPTGTMPDSILEHVLDDISELPKLQEVVLGGLGEPLLHPRIQEVVSRLKDHDLLLTITSNGTLLKPVIDDFLDAGVDQFVFSYETGDIGHANERDIFETIQSIRQRKRALYRQKPELVLFMVVTRENIQDLPHVAEHLRDSGIKKIVLSNLLPATKDQRHLVLYPGPEAEDVSTFTDQVFWRSLLDGVQCVAPNFALQTERSCDFIERHALVIRWDGEVAPCYRFLHARKELVLNTEKDLKACSFGNIQKNTLLDIWNGREYTWFRFIVSNSVYPSCLDCVFREGCSYLETQEMDCWGNEYSCGDCLWSRGIVKCP